MTPAFLLAIILAVAPTFVLGEGADLNGLGTPAPAANPGAIVGQVYQFALLIGGLMAFGAIVYGGIKYTVSAGNPSGKSDGREWIYGALWGLLLLLGSYLILHTINPNLTNLNLPTLTKLQPPPATPAGSLPGKCQSDSCGTGYICFGSTIPPGPGNSLATDIHSCSKISPPPPTQPGSCHMTSAGIEVCQ